MSIFKIGWAVGRGWGSLGSGGEGGGGGGWGGVGRGGVGGVLIYIYSIYIWSGPGPEFGSQKPGWQLTNFLVGHQKFFDVDKMIDREILLTS